MDGRFARAEAILQRLVDELEKAAAEKKIHPVMYLLRDVEPIHEIGDIAYLVNRSPDSLFVSRARAMEIIGKLTAFYESVTDDEIEALNIIMESEKSRSVVSGRVPTVSKSGYVYLIKASTGAYKIGMSKDPNSRIATFKTLPFDVELLALIQTDNMHELEKELHERFADKRRQGEWFNLSSEDVEYIKSLDDDIPF
jgi:hypothetical protein